MCPDFGHADDFKTDYKHVRHMPSKAYDMRL